MLHVKNAVTYQYIAEGRSGRGGCGGSGRGAVTHSCFLFSTLICEMIVQAVQKVGAALEAHSMWALQIASNRRPFPSFDVRNYIFNVKK